MDCARTSLRLGCEESVILYRRSDAELPAIAADIGASPVSLKLAVTSYLVALAIFIPISGWMADRYGAKNIFRIAIGVFAAGSVACAFGAPSPRARSLRSSLSSATATTRNAPVIR